MAWAHLDEVGRSCHLGAGGHRESSVRHEVREGIAIRIGRLKGVEFDPATFRHAQEVAARWRATGLTVDVIDYMPPAGEAHAYVLTASSPSTVMVLRCQRWRQRRWFRRSRLVWTITISVRQREGEDGDWQPNREVGAVAALDQEDLWEQIEAWIDGRLRPEPSLEAAVANLP